MIELNERQRKIMEYLREHNACKIVELSELMDVSEMTIRRDLEILEQDGKIIRTVGGAKHKSIDEFPFVVRKEINVEEKQEIAKIAKKLINEGDTIILDASSTAYVLSNYLPPNITVLTTNIQIALNLLSRNSIEIILIGGKVRKESATVIGYDALEMLDHYHVDKAFFSSKSLDLANGISDATADEGRIKQKIIESGEKIYCLMDTTKINTQSFYKVCTLDQVTGLITNYSQDDKTVNETLAKKCQELGVEYYDNREEIENE